MFAQHLKNIAQRKKIGGFPLVLLLVAQIWAQTPERLVVPPSVIDPPWLESRRQAQLATVGQFEVYYDFGFVDSFGLNLSTEGSTFFAEVPCHLSAAGICHCEGQTMPAGLGDPIVREGSVEPLILAGTNCVDGGFGLLAAVIGLPGPGAYREVIEFVPWDSE